MSLIITMVNAPVLLFQATGVTGAEEIVFSPKTCSLKDAMVVRPVLDHGSLVQPLILIIFT